MDFDDLNPPLTHPKSDPFFGCLMWIAAIAGTAGLIKCVFF